MAPWRLALITIMQFAEGLSDRQAADTVRARIDWKYALSLELADSGFDASVLCEFRARLLEGDSERLLFDHLLERFRGMGLVKARGSQRTDSTRILAVVRGLNRLELVGESMRNALDVLSTVAPEWLRGRVREEWIERYVRRLDDHRLPNLRANAANVRLIHELGGDKMIVGTDGPEQISVEALDAVAYALRDLAEITDALERYGYDGFFSIELFNADLWRLPAEEAARRCYESLLPICD